MKFNLRQIRQIILVICLILLSAWGGCWWGARPRQYEPSITSVKKEDIDLSLFWKVWDLLGVSYLDKSAIRPAEMVYGAIKGMVASLGDPYTLFLPPSDNKQVKEDLNGSFEGVGIQLGYNKDSQLVVIAPITGMPAEQAGVKAGDLILKIDEKETVTVNIVEAVKLIRGPMGTKVKLSLLHKGEDKAYEVTLVRTTVVIPSVEVKFIEGVAHLKLMKFGDRTAEEWDKTVTQILNYQPAVKGVVLDLRNNPGGYLDGSVFITSEFLARSGGKFSGVVVQQESARGIKETYSVDRIGKLINQPLVVLVNEGSASASEIVAGALQEYSRAKIVGGKTFGKGSIQEAQDLDGGAGLHITTSRWLLPSGKSVEKVGVIPDLEVEDNPDTETDEQLEKAFKLF